jgi:hypothetical protein
MECWADMEDDIQMDGDLNIAERTSNTCGDWSVVDKKKKRRKGFYYKDIILKCNGCGNRFVFEAMKQMVYETRGWVQPKNCPECIKMRNQIVKKI